MVSITISVPEEVRVLMNRFPEINWSGLVRKVIAEKARELALREDMHKEIKKEKDFSNWAVRLIRESRG